MPNRDLRVLPLLDKSSWVLTAGADGGLTAHLVDATGPLGHCETIGSSEGGWDTALDGDGTPWVVFVSADTGCIAARRAGGPKWGPSLQVSAESGQEPLIRADEFNNVWVFWKSEFGKGEFQCRVCRMGPRSGQEMVAATFDVEHDIQDAGSRGGVIWFVAGDLGSDPWIVHGTEHGGFYPATRIPSAA